MVYPVAVAPFRGRRILSGILIATLLLVVPAVDLFRCNADDPSPIEQAESFLSFNLVFNVGQRSLGLTREHPLETVVLRPFVPFTPPRA